MTECYTQRLPWGDDSAYFIEHENSGQRLRIYAFPIGTTPIDRIQREMNNGLSQVTVGMQISNNGLITPTHEENISGIEITHDSLTVRISQELGPSGMPGYNIAFPTDKNFSEYLEVMQKFLPPSSEVMLRTSATGQDFQTDPSIKTMSDLIGNEDSVSQADDSDSVLMFAHLKRGEHGVCKSFPMVWYNKKTIESKLYGYDKCFAVNVSHFDEEMFGHQGIARLSSYPIGTDELRWLKALFDGKM